MGLNSGRSLSSLTGELTASASEQQIREQLISDIESTRKSDQPKPLIRPEFSLNIRKNRIDLAVISDQLIGYEIKTDYDCLSRLPKQIQAYNNVFDKITLVVGSKLIIPALHIIPDWWGVKLALLGASGEVKIYSIRTAKKNKAQDRLSIIQLLWREEALSILSSINQELGVKSKTRSLIHARLNECNRRWSDIKHQITKTIAERSCYKPAN